MGIFSRLFGSGAHEFKNYGLFRVEAVGESYTQDVLTKIAGKPSRRGHADTFDAELELEDSNPHDDQAVRILIRGCQVGYLSRADARRHRQFLSDLGRPRAKSICRAMICGGWYRSSSDRGDFGVRLDLTY